MTLRSTEVIFQLLRSCDLCFLFISKDEKGRVIPCSPQKIWISNTHVLRPGKTATPVGFQTGYKSYIKKKIEAIDNILMDNNNGQLAGTFKISKEDACKIVKEWRYEHK